MHRKTVIHLPFPPSNNALYGARSGHGKGRYKLPRYVAWLAEANASLSSQITTRLMAPLYSERVNMIYVWLRPDRRKRDLNNFYKAADDFLVSANLLLDDSLIHGVTSFWHDNTHFNHFQCARPKSAGVTITIEDAR